MDSSITAFWIAYVALLSAAALIDAATYKIPNVIAAALAFVAMLAIVVTRPEVFVEHFLIAAIALIVGFALFQWIGMGAGDAKILSAVFLWTGLERAIPFMFWFGVACGVLVIFLIIGRRILAPNISAVARWRPFHKSAPVPLALAIAPAAIIASLETTARGWPVSP